MDPNHTSNTSPFAEEPVLDEATAEESQEPRLSIMHLLVWTACVAVWFSFTQTLTEYGHPEPTGVFNAFPVLHGLEMGTALAAMVLLLSRRLRGVPLAKYPGKYLLLLFSVRLVSSALTRLLGVSSMMEVISMPGLKELSLTVHVLVAMAGGILYLAQFGVLLLAYQRVKAHRWRVLFMIAWNAVILQHILPGFLISSGLQSGRFLQPSSSLVLQIATVALFVVVVMDLRERVRYPWPHWLGVGLQFWFGLTSFASFAYHYLFTNLPP